jgi:DNA-binding IclR family transcriptional regulator
VPERLELVALTNHTITDRDRLRQEIERVLVAAINVSALAASTPMGVLRKRYLSALLRTAAAIQADLASESAHARAR